MNFDPESIRQILTESLPETASQYGSAPETRYIYTPFSHARALDPNTVIVQGNRGSGKSLWWSALLSKEHRRLLSQALPKAGVQPDLIVTNGFSANPDIETSIPKDVIQKLCLRYSPRSIWKTILARQVFSDQSQFDNKEWYQRVEWVSENVEQYERMIALRDGELNKQGKVHLVVFDALENVAVGWSDLRKMIRGLLELGSDWRSRRSLRIKVFLRPDMLEGDSTVFPDASKLLSSKAELTWNRTDLYGLLWQYVGNARSGEVFRKQCFTNYEQDWVQIEGTFKVPEQMRTNEELQRTIFHAIAGPWMGTDRKRGFPYTWLVNHLADAHGYASARNFLTALRETVATPNPPNWDFALHYKAIHNGVQAASRLRVDEISEDYPWLRDVMNPLSGLTVPCEIGLIEDRWRENRTLEQLDKRRTENTDLPPAHLIEGHLGLRKDLEQLGLLQTLTDGRVQMPDLYRVAFGLKRRGGVKPLK